MSRNCLHIYGFTGLTGEICRVRLFAALVAGGATLAVSETCRVEQRNRDRQQEGETREEREKYASENTSVLCSY